MTESDLKVKWQFRLYQEDRTAHAFTLSDWKFKSLCGKHNFLVGQWAIAKDDNPKCSTCKAILKENKDGK